MSKKGKEKVKIIGIETSCDETAVAIVEDGRKILSNLVASQVDFHRKFKGVVPEIASRKHLEIINSLIDEALFQANLSLKDLSAIAVTLGPGLIGALLIGVSTAKALSYATSLPLIGVNHLLGHIWANFLEDPQIKFPFISLIVSGGHTSIILVEKVGKYKIIGETLDDAAGEALDKIAGFMNLGYPGGPIIDELAQEGNPQAINFPRAMIKKKGYDLSLSGLKTAALNYVTRVGQEKINVPDFCASFQEAIFDVLVDKVTKAAQEFKIPRIVLAGGVGANTRLREKLLEEAKKFQLELYFPSPFLCTDNAAMIAAFGYEKFLREDLVTLEVEPDANFPLR